jgi:tRNA-binding EMAP/Myf-like protein
MYRTRHHWPLNMCHWVDMQACVVRQHHDTDGVCVAVAVTAVVTAAEAEMQNRRVVCVTNLKPAAMRGIVSQAMVLAATHPETGKVFMAQGAQGGVHRTADGALPM